MNRLDKEIGATSGAFDVACEGQIFKNARFER